MIKQRKYKNKISQNSSFFVKYIIGIIIL